MVSLEGRAVIKSFFFVTAPGCSSNTQSVPQGRICLDNCPCCHAEFPVSDQTFDLTQS